MIAIELYRDSSSIWVVVWEVNFVFVHLIISRSCDCSYRCPKFSPSSLRPDRALSGRKYEPSRVSILPVVTKHNHRSWQAIVNPPLIFN